MQPVHNNTRAYGNYYVLHKVTNQMKKQNIIPEPKLLVICRYTKKKNQMGCFSLCCQTDLARTISALSAAMRSKCVQFKSSHISFSSVQVAFEKELVTFEPCSSLIFINLGLILVKESSMFDCLHSRLYSRVKLVIL